ncbi:MAG: hypothetical protein IJF67_12690, partial [Clostridia bacterium]|nr:hypothetical protein [Clostridia bacterium]
AVHHGGGMPASEADERTDFGGVDGMVHGQPHRFIFVKYFSGFAIDYTTDFCYNQYKTKIFRRFL